MRARYTIFAKAGYIMETFCGAVTFEQLKEFLHQQHRDPRILPQHHTVSDYTQATLRLSIAEVEDIARIVCHLPHARNGKRAMVINGSRNFAFTDVFGSYIAQAGMVSQCFTYRDAALRWVTQPAWQAEAMVVQPCGIFR